MDNILQWIAVGEVSAERDDNLAKYFYDNGVTEKILNSSKHFLILGRKGAGKTAVFLHLKDKPQHLFDGKDIIIALSTHNYNWKAHAILSSDEKGSSFTYRDSWRLVLAIETIKQIADVFEKNDLVLPTPLHQANNLLHNLFSAPLPSWSDLIRDKIFRLSKIKLPNLSIPIPGFNITIDGGEVSTNEVESSPSLKTELSKNIEHLTFYLESCLKETLKNTEFRIFIIFDKLDENWVRPEIDNCKKILSGLIHACEHVVSEFSSKIRPIVFLREDIFNSLEINDLNKLRQDCSQLLMWDSDSLEKMMLSRIAFFANQHNVIAPQRLADIFVQQTMRSQTPPDMYIFKKTFCKPRDMVAFYSKIIATAKENYPAHEFIPTKAIYDAESAYSEYLYEELNDEWAAQYTYFHLVMSSLENHRYTTFSEQDFTSQYQTKVPDVDRSRIRAWLRWMFDNSIIGIQVGNSTEWRYKCFRHNQAFQDSDKFKVHPGLSKRLGLTEKRSGSGDV